MIKSLIVAQNRNQSIARNILFISSSVLMLVNTYMFSAFSRFFEGTKHSIGKESDFSKYFSGTGTPAYIQLSDEYSRLFILVLLVSIISFALRHIIFDILNFLLIILMLIPIFRLFSIKKDIYNVEIFHSPYFDIVRNTIGFDLIGIILFFIASGALLVILVQQIWNPKDSRNPERPRDIEAETDGI